MLSNFVQQSDNMSSNIIFYYYTFTIDVDYMYLGHIYGFLLLIILAIKIRRAKVRIIKKRLEILPYDHLLLMPMMLFQLHIEQFYFTQKKI